MSRDLHLHPLLLRQLKALGLDAAAEAPAAGGWHALLDAVSSAYRDHERVDTPPRPSRLPASPEPKALYDALKAERDQLESRVRDRTEALQVSEDRLRRALDASGLALWDFDVAGGSVYLSESWSELMGGPRVVTRTTFAALAERVPQEERPGMQAALHAALKDSRAIYRVEHRVRTDDGRWLWNLSTGRVVERAADGRAVRMVGTNRDITERKLADLALQQSEARFRALTELSSDWYWEQDEQFRFQHISGTAGTSYVGKTIWDLGHEAMDEAAWQDYRRRIERHEPFRDIELRRRDRRGTLYLLAVSGAPIFDERGRFSGYRGVARDLTARLAAEASLHALEAQLRESQKMEAVGTLAGGIAHDFNNILGSILGNVGLVQQDVGAVHPALARLEQIHKAASRARSLVQQILAFSRRQAQEFVSRPLRPVVDETLTLLRSTLPARVALDAVLDEAPMHVLADATQMQQVLMNLCTNAWHALDDGAGRIEVGLAPSGGGAGLAPGRYAHLWVRDDGSGIDPAVRARIFDPFYTTKPVGQGTGLGLSVVHGIVSAHHGAITVDSTPGEGTTFHLYFPLLDGAAAAALSEWGSLADDPAVPAGRGEQVLYVDDDEVMTLMVEGLLARAGYRVTTYQDAAQAVAAVRSEPQRFDLVVTDFNMPELTGLDMARTLAALRPGLPVVISSGYISEQLRADALAAGVRQVMNKESTFEELPALVRRLLSQ